MCNIILSDTILSYFIKDTQKVHHKNCTQNALKNCTTKIALKMHSKITPKNYTQNALENCTQKLHSKCTRKIALRNALKMQLSLLIVTHRYLSLLIVKLSLLIVTYHYLSLIIVINLIVKFIVRINDTLWLHQLLEKSYFHHEQ